MPRGDHVLGEFAQLRMLLVRDWSDWRWSDCVRASCTWCELQGVARLHRVRAPRFPACAILHCAECGGVSRFEVEGGHVEEEKRGA
jgi:RNase P subunit RPR2